MLFMWANFDRHLHSLVAVETRLRIKFFLIQSKSKVCNLICGSDLWFWLASLLGAGYKVLVILGNLSRLVPIRSDHWHVSMYWPAQVIKQTKWFSVCQSIFLWFVNSRIVCVFILLIIWKLFNCQIKLTN